METETQKLLELSQLRLEILAEQAEPIWREALTSPVQIDNDIGEDLTEEDEYIYWTN